MARTQILSPLPGTFYRKSAPDQPPYKNVGDRIELGDVIGLIEVMKSFNEVKADAAGRIVELRDRKRGAGDGGSAARRGRKLGTQLAMAIRSLLIANRGEIAVRIIRAARELGIRTVQAHSQADANSLAVRLADRAVDIGPPHAAKSYLNIPAILEAARSTGVDAVHPGYGFLAENADFADAVEAAGLIFVGPPGQAIRLMGDKVAARSVAAGAGVATVPGSEERIEDVVAARAVVERIGYPVMIKAAAGGGGRGIRVAADRGEFEQLLPQARAEAKAAFGDGGLYVEKIIERSRHVEVQVLGDGDDVVHCFERECSLQRRRQKVWEEARCPALPPDIRDRMCASAIALAKRVHYRGAGTIEFLYEEEAAEFYFLEMNTRIQVEHPVTELITGIDLVREMIRIAGGEKLRLSQGDIRTSGHAIEVRINAEDPARNFMPSPGVVSELHRSRRAWRALRQHALYRVLGTAFLQFTAGEAHRVGRRPCQRNRTSARCAGRTRNRGREDDQAAASGAGRR